MNAVGMNTAINTSVMPMTGPVISSIALIVASRAWRPLPIHRSMFSTTTIESSTTMPTASTRPNKLKLLSEKPSAAITTNVPIRATTMSMIGSSIALQSWRKNITTTITSAAAM